MFKFFKDNKKMKRVTAEDEYSKNKHIRPEDVKMLLEWASKQAHLPQISELEAIFFLNSYGGSIELAKGLIDTYYTSRTHCPEFFAHRNPKDLAKDMNVVLFYPFESANAFYTVYIDTDPSHLNINEQIKILWMICDLWLLEKGCVDGFDFIIDMKGVQFGHVAKLNIVSMKKALFILQEAIPMKVTRIHIVNVMSLADKIFNMLKPFIKVELLDKIVFHSNGTESLKTYIPESKIPENLGGKGPTLQEMHEKMKKMLLENAKYFKQEELRRVDETKRLGKPKNSSELFGIEGSFKRLDID